MYRSFGQSGVGNEFDQIRKKGGLSDTTFASEYDSILLASRTRFVIRQTHQTLR